MPSKLRIVPLTINEFKIKYEYRKSSKGYLIANYSEYLQQNKHQHHYDKFVLTSEWFSNQIDNYLKDK